MSLKSCISERINNKIGQIVHKSPHQLAPDFFLFSRFRQRLTNCDGYSDLRIRTTSKKRFGPRKFRELFIDI